MLARWISVLNTYDFSIIHRKGMNHGNADGLSWRSCTNAECADCGVSLQYGCEHKSLSPKIQAVAVRSRVAESEEYDPTPTPEIFKMPTPTPNFNFDSDSLVWAKYLS